MTYTPESNWILESHTVTAGRGSVKCHRWRWVNVDTGETRETTTDSTMRNWRRCGWDRLAEDPNPWGAYQNIHPSTDRQTNRGVGVASADYQARLNIRMTERERDLAIAEIQRPSSITTTTFDDVFTTE